MRSLGGQAWRFASVGALNTLIGVSTIWLFMLFGFAPLVANAAGFAVGLCISFVLNRNWTFQAGGTGQGDARALGQGVRFGLTFLVAWSLNALVVLTGDSMTGISPYLLQVAGVGVYSVTFFVLCRVFVFKSPVS